MADRLLTRRDELRNWWGKVRHRIIPRPPYAATRQREGQYLAFIANGARQGYTTYTILSRRGGFAMGTIEWSPQWGAYSFVPAVTTDVVRWNALALADVYAFLKECGQVTGRFV